MALDSMGLRVDNVARKLIPTQSRLKHPATLNPEVNPKILNLVEPYVTLEIPFLRSSHILVARSTGL